MRTVLKNSQFVTLVGCFVPVILLRHVNDKGGSNAVGIDIYHFYYAMRNA